MAYSPLHDTAPPSYNEVVQPKVRYCHTPGVGDGRDSRTTAPTVPCVPSLPAVQDQHEPPQPAYHLLVLYKDRTGRLGMSMASVNGSILVNYVQPSSPAELAGLKFGDEIASVNGQTVAGFSADRTGRLIKSSVAEVSLMVRDRPFTQTYLLEKGLDNTVGLHLMGNKVVKIEQGSSAERCGMEVNQYIIDVNGQCVAGQENKTVEIISKGPPGFFVVVLPKHLYKQMPLP